MENKIKKNLSKIIEVFILMQPFIDLLTGILVHNNVNLTLGIIIRTVFLAFVMLITVFIFKFVHNSSDKNSSICIKFTEFRN